MKGKIARAGGFEPPVQGPKPCALPLGYALNKRMKGESPKASVYSPLLFYNNPIATLKDWFPKRQIQWEKNYRSKFGPSQSVSPES